MERLFLKIMLVLVLFLNTSPVFAQFAEQKGTVLPETKVATVLDCQILMTRVEMNMFDVRDIIFIDRNSMPLSDFGLSNVKYDGSDTVNLNDVLGCGIKTGDIALWMVPFYIRYILEFILGLAGLVSIAGIIIGGFMYLFSGFSDNKDRGKLALMYSVAGFLITIVSFAVVNIVIAIVTG